MHSVSLDSGFQRIYKRIFKGSRPHRQSGTSSPKNQMLSNNNTSVRLIQVKRFLTEWDPPDRLTWHRISLLQCLRNSCCAAWGGRHLPRCAAVICKILSGLFYVFSFFNILIHERHTYHTAAGFAALITCSERAFPCRPCTDEELPE